MVEITVPVPAGVFVPEDAVQVPNSFLIWRDGLEVHAVLPDGRYLRETCQTEEIAVANFVHYAYMH